MTLRRLSRSVLRGCFPHELSWLIDNPIRRWFITPEGLADRLPLSRTSRVLEIGPGSGYFSEELARRVRDGRLELLDLQPEMLEKAKRKLDLRGVSYVGYIAADAMALPFREGAFDVAVLVTVLGEVPNAMASLRAIHRVLVRRGTLAVHEHIPDPDFVPFERLRSLAEANGFEFQLRWGRDWNYTAIFRTADAGLSL